MNNINYEYYGKIVSPALLNNNTIYMCRAGHHMIFTMEKLGVLRCSKQGFVTEYGLFVDRMLGLKIAEYYNQINKKYHPFDELLSEDLKKENLKILKYEDKYSYKEKKI